MSFILDALKKSELERQRQSAPGLIEMPVATRRRRIPVWVWVLAGLLCINVAVLLVLMLRSSAPAPAAARANAPVREPARDSANRDTDPRRLSARNPPVAQAPAIASPDVAAAETPTDAAPAARAPDHFSPLDNQPVYAPEIPVQSESAARPSGAPATSAPNLTAPTARATRRADPVLNDQPSDDDEMLPTLSELNLTGSQTLPEIHLDVHVYATRTADRFVYINMRKYHEGAVLQEGPTLEHIRRDGVVLNYNGLRFLVPRQ